MEKKIENGIELTWPEFYSLNPPKEYEQSMKFGHYDQYIIDHRNELGEKWLNFHGKKHF